MKNGTGLSYHEFDNKNKCVSIDFSGNDKRQSPDGSYPCFRNDASIFFYAGNSYLTSFYVLSQQIKKSFEAENRKEVEHLILPYYFNFRHYLELELKALIIGLTNEAPELTHELKNLWEKFSKQLHNLEYISDFVRRDISQEFFEIQKRKLIENMESTQRLLESYTSNEPNVEYYRFIFDTSMELKTPVIKLDFLNTDKDLRELAEKFKEINVNLREIVYLYFTI